MMEKLVLAGKLGKTAEHAVSRFKACVEPG
jgi:hypothetical protein